MRKLWVNCWKLLRALIPEAEQYQGLDNQQRSRAESLGTFND
jgi:hypothetical protein